MPLAPGARLGTYEVVALLGAGGMGEVYRARDTRLGRDVAIKVLPEAFTQDPERLARFDREARIISQLNHPNICALYHVADAPADAAAQGFSPASIQFLVLELVEGPTLADLIAKGPVPIADALRFARQIADALEAAHEHGITHRDLKPANIKITADENVKVLDFGLAKLAGPDSGSLLRGSDMSQSPTITSPALATHAGVILGTAAYMSPEQARGKPVDRRTDVWAFGCVLYEMLTGKRAFDADDVTGVLARILEREPDYAAFDRVAPRHIQRLVRRCLEKDRKRRIADFADVRFELDEVGPTELPVPTTNRRRWLWAGAATLVALVIGVAVGLGLSRPASGNRPAESVRFSLNFPPELVAVGGVAISPDGRHVAFNAARAGENESLWLRPLSSMAARPLAGTEGSSVPFWSPDSRSIAFSVSGALKRIDLANGAVTTILGNTARTGVVSWGTQDELLFPRGPALHRLRLSGGAPELVAAPPEGAYFGFPSFLPDGRRYIFAELRTLVPRRGAATIYFGTVGSAERRELLRADSGALYANGHLLFVRDSTLMAQPFDEATGTFNGEAVSIAENVWPGSGGIPYFSVSQNGALAFPAHDTATARLVWLDRTGKEVAAVGNPADFSNPRVSPDGKKIAVCIYDTRVRTRDIWVLDVERGTRMRLTDDPGDDMNPVWSPDGSAIAFSSDRKGTRDIYRKELQGSEDELVLASSVAKSVSDWAPGGRRIAFSAAVPLGGGVVFVDISDRKSPQTAQFQDSRFSPGDAVFSPDGKWVAFRSAETGGPGIYVAPASGGGKVIVSNGGIQPRWSRDGREIFYLNTDRDRMMSVPVVNATGPILEAGAPRELFRVDVADALGSLYDVSPDGRFLVNARVGGPITPITVVLNWPAALASRAAR